MNIERITTYFKIFCPDADETEFSPIITLAVDEVKKMLKADADEDDARLDPLCAAFSALKYDKIYCGDKLCYTPAGTVDEDGNIEVTYKLHSNLFDDYMALAIDLLEDKDFVFENVGGDAE